jgi:hypothetical protein
VRIPSNHRSGDVDRLPCAGNPFGGEPDLLLDDAAEVDQAKGDRVDLRVDGERRDGGARAHLGARPAHLGFASRRRFIDEAERSQLSDQGSDR